MSTKQSVLKKRPVKFGLNWIKRITHNVLFAGSFTLVEMLVLALVAIFLLRVILMLTLLS
jgi:hypothetical protein